MVRRLKSIPKGFRLVKGATTSPVGYRLYTDRKGSRFTKKKAKYVLVRRKK
jgi:hypothetical protein|tara:strand:- start:1296 stop:1448 length:153 start_codon:yes stop_codon:yes gene_type:complete